MTDEEKAAADAKAAAEIKTAADAKAAADAAAKTAADQAATATAAGAGSAGATGADDVASLPEWAQKLIRTTRTEAATNRTKATTAGEALEATRDAIAKALGLKPDDDPVKAAQTAADQRDAALQEAKATKIENAVLRSATKHGANPEALTDSRTFMAKLADMDPAADDFATQVDEAIKKAVEDNPLLKLEIPAPRSGGPVGGGAAIPGQLTADDVQKLHAEGRSAEIVKAKEEGRLNNLLGID